MIKAATLAAMSTPNAYGDTSDTEELCEGIAKLIPLGPSFPSLDNHSSNRKRLRGSKTFANEMDQASNILGGLSVREGGGGVTHNDTTDHHGCIPMEEETFQKSAKQVKK